jgi:hypothetical protein
MALRTNSVRRTTDHMEDAAAWVLVAVGLLVVLFSCGFGKQFYDQIKIPPWCPRANCFAGRFVQPL